MASLAEQLFAATSGGGGAGGGAASCDGGAARGWVPAWLLETVEELRGVAMDEELFGDVSEVVLSRDDVQRDGGEMDGVLDVSDEVADGLIRDFGKLGAAGCCAQALKACIESQVELARVVSDGNEITEHVPILESLCVRGALLARIVVCGAWHQLESSGSAGWSKSSSWREAYAFGQLLAVRNKLMAMILTTASENADVAPSGGGGGVAESGLCDTLAEHSEALQALRACLKRIDMCFIMGAPPQMLRLIVEIVEGARNACVRRRRMTPSSAAPATASEACLPDGGSLGEFLGGSSGCTRIGASTADDCGSSARTRERMESIRRPCPEAPKDMPASSFKAQFFDRDEPVVFRGYGGDWRCARAPDAPDGGDGAGADHIPGHPGVCWSKLQSWKDRYGHRYVPLEIGSHNDPRWHEAVMEFGDFIEKFLGPSARTDQCEEKLAENDVGYLAQHPLLTQFHDLNADFTVPHFIPPGELTRINFWIGTRNTVSPCHFDSYENLFAQVQGYKYMKIFPSACSPYMYRTKRAWVATKAWPGSSRGSEAAEATAGEGDARLGTISEVDVMHPDREKYPLFEKAEEKMYEVVLAPGDVLYLPAGCFHYVEALSTSISLNFLF